jgi:hypothetical protein
MKSRNLWRTALGVGALLLLYWLLAVSTSGRMGVTADEVVHLTAGYSYGQFNDYRLQPENGTLAMRAAALPLMGLDLKWVPALDHDWQHSLVNRVGYEFFYKLGNPLPRMLLLGRATIALFGVLTLWLIWRWARGLFGARAGWLALALAVFCPALLAHGALITSDMAITTCLLLVVTVFWRLLHIVTWPRLLLAIAASGAVLLAKMSGVLAAPMLVLLLLFRWAQPAPLVVQLGRTTRWLRPRRSVIGATLLLTLVTAAGGLGVLWAGYGFRYSAFHPSQQADAHFYFEWPAILDEDPLPNPWPDNIPSRLAGTPRAPQPTAGTRLIAWVRDHRLLPEAYLWGMAHTHKFSRWRPAFLNGEFRTTGWPQFFPWAFWLKTTLPALALLGAGIWAACRRRAPGSGLRPRWLYRSAPLLMLFFIYWSTALAMTLNIGHRHILPTYPVVYIFAGAAALWLCSRPRQLIALTLALGLTAHAADSYLARPFYLSYFQPLGGGLRGGWRHLIDSSYDWGQGLPDLARWIETQRAAGEKSPIYLTYFGADSPRARSIPATRFADDISDVGNRVYPVWPTGGWFAISATHFQRVYLRIEQPWDFRTERLYQELRASLAQSATQPSTAPDARARLLRNAMDFEVLEFGRLCHFLRDREPDTVVGGSILMFKLTDREVAFALNAPLSAFPPAK